MVKQSARYVTETLYGTHSFTSEVVALAFENLADKIMFESALKIKQASDDSFRFKVNNRLFGGWWTSFSRRLRPRALCLN